MTWQYLAERRRDRTVSLWRCDGHRWQYWSLLKWQWCDTDPVHVMGPPPTQRLVTIPELEAELLTTDWRHWIRCWVMYRRRELGGADVPVTVVRRRDSPEAAADEVFGADCRWRWTDALVRYQTGRGSGLPSLQPVDGDEADQVLQHTHHTPAGAIGWALVGDPPPCSGEQDLPQHVHQAAAVAHQQGLQRHHSVDVAVARLLRRTHPKHRITRGGGPSLKPWMSYLRNVAAAVDWGEPAETAVIQPDLHRYSLVLPFGRQHAEAVADTLHHLHHAGFDAVPGTCWDHWGNPTSQGVTTVWRHRTGVLVEIQLHIRHSHQAMILGTEYYEVLRRRHLPYGGGAVTPIHRAAARVCLAELNRPQSPVWAGAHAAGASAGSAGGHTTGPDAHNPAGTTP